MEDRAKRFLKYHFKEIDANPNLPICLNYTQIYTRANVDDKGKMMKLHTIPKIHVKEYQVPDISLYPVFHKPISKCINIVGDVKSND